MKQVCQATFLTRPNPEQTKIVEGCGESKAITTVYASSDNLRPQMPFVSSGQGEETDVVCPFLSFTRGPNGDHVFDNGTKGVALLDHQKPP